MSESKRREDLDGSQAEGTVAWEVTSPLNLGQFRDEATRLLGSPVTLVAEGGISEPPSEETPMLLWFSDVKSSDHDGIEEALEAHEPDEGWDPNVEGSDADRLESLRERAESGENLTMDEAALAVTLLLRGGVSS